MWLRGSGVRLLLISMSDCRQDVSEGRNESRPNAFRMLYTEGSRRAAPCIPNPVLTCFQSFGDSSHPSSFSTLNPHSVVAGFKDENGCAVTSKGVLQS